jgi:hypothetical protein
LRRLTTTFEKVEDYAAFEAVLEEAREQVDMRLLAFCVMPNHWHLVHGTVGTGPLYQGRFKSFPIQEPEGSRDTCRLASPPRRSVWDWNPRYVPLAAQNASVPTGEPSHDAANRHK